VAAGQMELESSEINRLQARLAAAGPALEEWLQE
jgi:hypothetical protein